MGGFNLSVLVLNEPIITKVEKRGASQEESITVITVFMLVILEF